MKKIVLVVVLVAVLFFAYFQFKSSEKQPTQVQGGDSFLVNTEEPGNYFCVNVPPNLDSYDNKDNPWGEVHRGLKTHLGHTKEQADRDVGLVWAFFKEIDVKPERNLVKMFQDEIEHYLDSGLARQHWKVKKLGKLRCKPRF